MPQLEILSNSGAVSIDGRPTGVIGNFPDKDGTYILTTGEEVSIEMNPPEAEGLVTIALTSVFFEGHERSVGRRGKARRVIHLGKRNSGSTDLSFYETLQVTLVPSSVK